MGSGIAGKRRLPGQGTAGQSTPDHAGMPVGDRALSNAPSGHPTDLISPQPLSYEERRDRWLRANGTLWRAESESTERQRM